MASNDDGENVNVLKGDQIINKEYEKKLTLNKNFVPNF